MGNPKLELRRREKYMAFCLSSSSDAHLAAFATALQGISPGLAALHVSRLRLRNPDIVDSSILPSTCIRCGHHSVSNKSSRVRRNKTARKSNKADNSNNPQQRVIERTCSSCQFTHIVPITRGNASLFPASRKRKKTREPNPSALVPVPSVKEQSLLSSLPVPASAPPPTSATIDTRPGIPSDAIPIKRNKKKAGLQELLARSRQKQEQERRKLDASQGKPGSLAFFLEGL